MFFPLEGTVDQDMRQFVGDDICVLGELFEGFFVGLDTLPADKLTEGVKGGEERGVRRLCFCRIDRYSV